MTRLACVLAILVSLALTGCRAVETGQSPKPSAVPIDHLIVIVLENRGFDHLFGLFPGARGLSSPGSRIPQTDRDGRPYPMLPPVLRGWGQTDRDPRFGADLPNAPFLLDRYVPPTEKAPDPVHRFYTHQLQINGGRMDRYVAWSDTGGLPMAHHDVTKLPLFAHARRYVVADHFFTAAFGGSWLNHMWLVCACAPVYGDAPAAIRAQPALDPAGRLVGLVKDGNVTPDGFAVNDLQPFARPYRAGTADPLRLPPQTYPTIGDRLSAANVSWAWYAGGWNDAVAGRPAPLFQFHHHPFVYFAAYAEGTAARARHLKDETDFLRSATDGTLPAVSFVKPLGDLTGHPGYSTVHAAEAHALALVQAVERSPAWRRAAIVVTYDDYGGWFDHVPPPVVDRWGPGTRVPTIIISPWAKRGFVDSTPYDHTSILKFIRWRWGLSPLGTRDAAAANLLNAFDFGRRP